MRLVVVSFRLGAHDGVSIEARKWCDALRLLGHDVSTLAGEGDADALLPGLAAGATQAPSGDELTDALAGADVVVVENMASLPLNVAARQRLYDVLTGRRAIFHHHDFAWQRQDTLDPAPPRDEPAWTHVVINERSRRELAGRGVSATLLYNRFDCDPPRGRRALVRERLALDTERLLLVPSRVIARKNVAGALELARALRATLWFLGPTEDGYDDTFDSLVEASSVPVRQGLGSDVNVHDAYAAADLVVVASTWEGFGNPVLESVTHRRPLAVYPYPVLAEIRDMGFHFYDLSDHAALEAALVDPPRSRLETNLALAREHFNLDELPSQLETLLRTGDARAR